MPTNIVMAAIVHGDNIPEKIDELLAQEVDCNLGVCIFVGGEGALAFLSDVQPLQNNFYSAKYNGVDILALAEMNTTGGYYNKIIQSTIYETALYYIYGENRIRLAPGKLQAYADQYRKYPNNVGIIYNDREDALLKQFTIADLTKVNDAFSLPKDYAVSSLALQNCGLYRQDIPAGEDYDLVTRICTKHIIVQLPHPLTLKKPKEVPTA